MIAFYRKIPSNKKFNFVKNIGAVKMNEIILKCKDGILTVNEQDVIIDHKGFLGCLSHGESGVKTIPTKSIAYIQVKKANLITNGYIHFGLFGTKKITGIISATQDENTVVFSGNENNQIAEQIKLFIENIILNNQEIASINESQIPKPSLDINSISNEKIYQKTWFMIFMLVLFFPIGIFLLWKYAPYQKKAKAILTCICLILLFFINTMSPEPNYTSSSTIKSEINQNLNVSNQAILGAPTENFKKVYGKLNDKYSNSELQMYKFIDPVIEIEGNSGDLEKVQVIHIDLRKYDENTHKLIKPEVFPVQSMQEIDKIIAKYIPSDSVLIKEKTFKDTSLTLPTSRHITLRLYKSKWLSENLIPFEKLPDYDRSDFLPDGIFNVKIDKLERGYLKIYLCFGTGEWNFIDSRWQEI